MSATVLHGGSLLLSSAEPELTTKPANPPIVAPPQQLPEASLPAPDPAAAWAPGAAPAWPPPPPYGFPMPPAPVLTNPWAGMSMPAVPPAQA